MSITLSKLMINSPLDQFEIISLLGFNAPLFGYLHIAITNLALYSIIVLIIVVGINYMGNNDSKLLPSKWSIFLESIFASINSIVREQIGKEIYLPFIYSLFIFILFANLIGIIPYSFTITSSAIVSIGISFTIFISVTILGLVLHNIKFISYISRAGSLGIRLFANMCAGHILLKILSSFLFATFSGGPLFFIIALIPFPIFIGIIGLELAICLIQAYVFTLLTCSYIKDALELH